MSLASFDQNFPDEHDGVLDCGSMAITCAFNRWGTLLAVGCNDGRLVIFDTLTRGIAQTINAHVHPVCSLSWSRTGHKLLTAATDKTVSIWDVLTGHCLNTFRFPSPVLAVHFHPRDDKTFLTAPMKHAAVLMNTEKPHRVIPLDEDGDANICTAFDRRGKHVFTGNGKGKVMIFDTQSLELKSSFRVGLSTSSVALRSVEFSRKGSCFLVNASDRIIRVYDVESALNCGINGELEPLQKLQDLVNKSSWRKCCFSGDGEHVVAGSSKQHSIYIWEKSNGNLSKFLLGSRAEMLLDVVWHPVKPIIISVASGTVSVWSQKVVENWSAFAPGFKELDENVEYEERESEFDVEDEDKEIKDEEVKDVESDEDLEVDVTTVEPAAGLLSSDEEENGHDLLVFIPIAPEIEDVEEDYAAMNLDETFQRKRSNSGSNESLPKRRKTIDVDLPDASIGDVHPLLNKQSSPSKGIQGRAQKGKDQGKTKRRS